MWVVQKALDLRAEHQGLAHLGVVQGLNAEKIPGAEKLPFLLVPDDKGEHAPQLVQQPGAVFLIPVQQHLRVGGGFKHMARCQQVLFNLLKIVDLPIKGEHLAPVLVEDGLAAALQVDDGKPPEPQGDGAVHIVIRVIGAAVANGVCHRAQHPGILLGIAAVDKANESTHGEDTCLSLVCLSERDALSRRCRLLPVSRGRAPAAIHSIILPQNGGK